jgi:hypothetical protein
VSAERSAASEPNWLVFREDDDGRWSLGRVRAEGHEDAATRAAQERGPGRYITTAIAFDMRLTPATYFDVEFLGYGKD